MVGGRDIDGSGPGSRLLAPWGLLGMLGLVLGIEWTIAGHDIDLTAPWHWDWRTADHQVRRKLAGRDILLFGDSLMKFGVMPRVIRERSGRSAFNLGLHTGQPSSSYFLLRRALDAGARPSAVILELTPHMFIHTPEENARLWPELLRPGECLDLARAMGSPGFFASTILASLLPSYKERHEIRAEVAAALGGSSASRRHEIASFRRNWKVNDGAQLMPLGPPPSLDPAHWEYSLYRKWRPDPVNEAYLDRFLALARSRSIPVLWLLPPIHPAVQARTDASGFDAEYSRYVRAVQSRFPGVIEVVDARRSGFSDGDFADGIHLGRLGALRLSAAVGDRLKGAPVPGRWSGLNLDRAGAVSVPMEDVGQSALVLRADGAARR